MKLRGIIYTALSAFLYGFTPALAGITYEMGNNPLSMTFFRNFFAVGFLLILIGNRKIDITMKRCDMKNIILVSVLGVLLSNILLYSSYSYIGIGATTTLHFMYPVFVALFARFAFGEELDKKKKITLVIASLGVLFFIDFTNIRKLIGVIFAVSSGVFYAFYMVWMEKKKLVFLNPYKISFYISFFCTGVLLIANFFFKFLRFNLSIKAYALIIIISISTSFIATVLLQLGIKEIGSTSAALFCLFEPITSIIAGALIFNESLTVTKIIGCIVIFFAITFLTVDNKPENDVEKIVVAKH